MKIKNDPTLIVRETKERGTSGLSVAENTPKGNNTGWDCLDGIVV